MSRFRSSKGYGLDEELCALVRSTRKSVEARGDDRSSRVTKADIPQQFSPPQPCRVILDEQVENLALVDDVWTGMALAPLR
jgi:hypothetical protein